MPNKLFALESIWRKTQSTPSLFISASFLRNELANNKKKVGKEKTTSFKQSDTEHVNEYIEIFNKLKLLWHLFIINLKHQ